jgi:hypothetical protein
MKKLFFALLFVFTFAHATDFSLEKDECIILVASTKSSSEAEELRKKYPGSELYTSKSGYIAVGLEKISKQGSSARIKELLSAGKIPKGSNCADNTRITGLLADGESPAQNTSKDTINPNAKSEKRNPSNDVQPVPAKTARALTGPQKNAVRAAKQYLSFKGFSRDGLIGQLTSEFGNGFEVNDATIAVDSMNVDWNEQAAKSAKSYLDMMGFSCDGLIKQLASSAGEKFTESQATFGARKAGGC